MDVGQKLAILADAAKYDASCSSSGSRRATAPGGLGNTEGMGICHSYTPDGRCVSLLKILFTNFCIFDCQYCVNRISSDVPRARFTVKEVVDLTLDFYKRNYIEGLFLSSGVLRSPDATMEQMIDVARTLRTEHRFGGYIHLKAVAGASQGLLDEAGKWADRLSANIELPTPQDLQKLAPEKKVEQIEGSMARLRDRIAESKGARAESKLAPTFAPAGQTTQMIVGATPTPDRAVLQTASGLYTRFGLRRIYYSAFSPIPRADARLPLSAPPMQREHRLYQADWLMRFYGFKADELTETQSPDLDPTLDPKLAWALRHRGFFPIDVNAAPREALWRIPGIGVRNVERILAARRVQRLGLAELKRLRVAVRRARPFIIASDHHPDAKLLDGPALRRRVAPAAPEQLSLFSSAQLSRTGEL